MFASKYKFEANKQIAHFRSRLKGIVPWDFLPLYFFHQTDPPGPRFMGWKIYFAKLFTVEVFLLLWDTIEEVFLHCGIQWKSFFRLGDTTEKNLRMANKFFSVVSHNAGVFFLLSPTPQQNLMRRTVSQNLMRCTTQKNCGIRYRKVFSIVFHNAAGVVDPLLSCDSTVSMTLLSWLFSTKNFAQHLFIIISGVTDDDEFAPVMSATPLSHDLL